MNKLFLQAVRRRAAAAIHPHNVQRGCWNRARVAMAALPLQRIAPMHAQWQRNATTGALECHWISDAPAAPQPDRRKARLTSSLHTHWHLRGAGLRPPLRHRVRG